MTNDLFAYISTVPEPLLQPEWKGHPNIIWNRKWRWKAAFWNREGFRESWVKVSARPEIPNADALTHVAIKFWDEEPIKGDHMVVLTLFLGSGAPLERWLLWADFKEVKAGELDYTGEDKEWTVEAATKVLRYESFLAHK